MAPEADFCGEHLRLAAFLRVVEHMPQRPSRLRVGGIERIQIQEAAASAPNANGRIEQMPSAAWAVSTQSKFNMPTDKIEYSHTEASPDIEGVTLVTLGTNSPSPSELLPMRPDGQQSVTIFSPQPNTPNSLPREVSKSKRQKRLRVGGLALVRTTTEYGLPSKDGEETDLTLPLTTTDPIEDSQLPFLIRPVKPEEQSPPTWSPAINVSRGALTRSHHFPKFRGETRASLDLKLAKSNSSPRRKRHSMLEAVCDGFVGFEITPTPARPRKRSEKGSRHQKPQRTSPRSTRLSLVGGFLPEPPLLNGTSTVHTTADDVHQITHGRFDKAHASTGYLPFDVDQADRTIQTHSVSAMRPRRNSVRSIVRQLSSIKAPVRFESVSETAASVRDRFEEECSDEDTAESSSSGHATYQPDMDQGDDFWLQYGGLE